MTTEERQEEEKLKTELDTLWGSEGEPGVEARMDEIFARLDELKLIKEAK